MASPQAMPQLVAESPKFVKVVKEATKIASLAYPVLVTGETGVGKEVIARLIHQESKRKNVFIAVSCPGIPKDLAESELFGYEKGAFTNATFSKPGFFELAEGGTIFLDEVGDLDQVIQAKILRVLENGSYRRLGGRSEQYADVRIIAATNRKKLQQNLRQDLYFRLDDIRIEVPPLRERQEDIEPLSGFFARPDHAVGTDALEKLFGHSWPGNVRELRNVVHRACIHAGNVTLHEKDVVVDDASVPLNNGFLLTTMQVLERRCLEAWLVEKQGRLKAVAAGMGISRQAVSDKLKKYGIDHRNFQRPPSS